MRFRITGMLLFLSVIAQGQSGVVYPDVFSSYFNDISLINPAYIPQEGRLELKAIYKFRRGLLSDISTFAASGSKYWNTDKNTSQAGRLIFQNEREGPYISSPKTYLNYALRLTLSSNTSLMTGLSLGFSGLSFTAPSGAGSVMLLDGGLGVILRHKKIDIGVSTLQMFNSEGVAISAPIRLQRYYNIHLTAEKSVTPALDLKGYFFLRNFNQIPDHLNAGGSILLQRFIELGGLYKYRRGISFFGALTISQDTNPLILSLSYNSSLLSSSPLWSDSFELGLQYLLK